MAKLNTLNLNSATQTHEGGRARNISTEAQLRRSVLACLLWEQQFYEDGVEIAGRIAELVPKVAAEKVAALAAEARESMKLRHDFHEVAEWRDPRVRGQSSPGEGRAQAMRGLYRAQHKKTQ